VPVRGDRDALEQALINLIGNAIKYSGEGRVIEVCVRGAGGGVEVVVRDHGMGIHPREHARIFDAYYRAPESHNGRTPGTGLGLSIVRHVAEGHGGRVSVESAPGRGAEFTVWLPAEGA
jgi:signal transduction histidine kinase